MDGVVVVVSCNHCNKTFNKKPSDIHSKNFCNRICKVIDGLRDFGAMVKINI